MYACFPRLGKWVKSSLGRVKDPRIARLRMRKLLRNSLTMNELRELEIETSRWELVFWQKLCRGFPMLTLRNGPKGI